MVVAVRNLNHRRMMRASVSRDLPHSTRVRGGGAEHSGEKCRRPQVGRVLLRLRSPRLEVRTWVGPRWREARYMYVHVTVHMDRTL
jgi:hypothetical protein